MARETGLETGRTFNLHHDPSHRGGRPHTTIVIKIDHFISWINNGY
jgi:hypothetical protein